MIPTFLKKKIMPRVLKPTIDVERNMTAFDFSWVWFYGISTSEGHLMPNPVDTYTLNIYIIYKHILLITLWWWMSIL